MTTNTVCLVVDRLHPGYLGPYGNSWIHTPAFDRLAAESCLFQQYFVDSPLLGSLYRSFWHGLHALCPLAPDTQRQPLAERLGARGIPATLMTDEPEVAQLGHGLGFSEVVTLDAPAEGLGAVDGAAPLAETVEETHLAGCFARLIDWLDTARGPFLLWCHLKGLGGPWDAPLELRRAYAGEDDPPPPESAEVPDRLLPPDYDPDELSGITYAYSGQVSLLDMCLGALCQYLREGPRDRDTLLVVASARGFPLGEHLRVGPCDHALYGELTWAPLLVRLPGAVAGAARSQAMVEPADLWATLFDWHGVVDPTGSPTGRSLLPLVRGEADTLRDRLAVAGWDGERALMTPAWSLRLAGAVELFAWPDDLWQVNNVANRCPDVAQAMGEILSQYEQALQSSQDPYTAALEAVLREGVE